MLREGLACHGEHGEHMKEDFVARSQLEVHGCLSFVSSKYVSFAI